MELEGLIPGWVLHARWVLWPALAFALVVAYGELARLWIERAVGAATADLHWSERARRAARVRTAPGLGLLATVVVFFWSWLAWSPLEPAAAVGPILLSAGAALCALVLMRRRVERALGLAGSLRTHLRSLAWLACLLGPQLGALLLLVGLRLRGVPAASVAYALGSAGVLLGFAGAGLGLARLLGLARPAGARVRAAVARASAGLDLRVRSVLTIDWDQANAFAVPLLGTLGVTPRAEALLTDEELVAVLRHELGHLSEGPAALVRLLPALGLVAGLALPFPSSWPSVAGLAAGLVALLVAARAFSRAMERRADRHVGADDPAYGRALLRLYEAKLAPAVSASGATHPHLYERLQAAGVTPDFPRPLPPAAVRSTEGVLLLSACVLGFALLFGLRKLAEYPATPARTLASLALNGPNARDLGRLGALAWEDDLARAAACYRAAARLAPGDPTWPYTVAQAEAARGACAEARRALEIGYRIERRSDAPTDGRLREQAEEAVDDCEPR